MVVDVVVDLSNHKNALAFAPKEFSAVVQNIDVIFTDFIQHMNGPAKDYLALASGEMDDKAIERAVDTFSDKQKREDFYKFFKELENLYEILSPDAKLRDYIAPYSHLAELYEVVRTANGANNSFT